jgi:hypothetical protein
VLAFALLGALAALGVPMATGLRTAPSASTPAEALGGGKYVPLPAPPQAHEGPDWDELSASQQKALAPLAEHWPLLSQAQKRNWLRLAAGFDALSAQEQAKLQARITDWANLSAQQRSQARLNYAAAARLAPGNLRAQWEAYQTLSAEEKKRLAAKALNPAGAATAVRPITRHKLASVPAAASAGAAPNLPKILPPDEPHAPQSPAPTPAPAPAAVETAPVATPSAEAVPLPPLPDDEAEPQPPAQQPSSDLYGPS